MDFELAHYSDVGRRPNNEDFFGISLSGDGLFAIVADGVGGSENGEVASRLAVKSLIREVQSSKVDEEVLADAIMRANEAICSADISGMTTVAAVWADHDSCVAAHVGDSRIYHFRDGRILFQSEDHSKVQLAVLLGELPPEALRNHKTRNQIFRALGEKSDISLADTTELVLCAGDRLLICSDGFWEPVLEKDMLRTMVGTDSAWQWLDAMRRIVVAAADPKQDNNTAICILVK